MPIRSMLAALGAEPFVALATFRRSGERVWTPVWVARDGDALVVTTGGSTGKAKRLRHDPRAELRVCDRRGRVPEGAPTYTAVGEVLTTPAEAARTAELLAAKYGLQYQVAQVVQRLARRGGERVTLRLVDDAAGR